MEMLEYFSANTKEQWVILEGMELCAFSRILHFGEGLSSMSVQQ